MQGRAFGFLALLGASWVAARIAIATVVSPARLPIVDAATTPLPTIANFASLPTFITEGEHWISTNDPVKQTARSRAGRPNIFRAKAVSPVFRRQTDPTASPTTPFPGQRPFSTPDHNARTPLTVAALSFATQGGVAAKTRPFDVYAYSFWRRGGAKTDILGSGEYGGSQSAIIADLPLLRFGKHRDMARLAVTARMAVAHGPHRERELAAGLKWRPSRDIPISVVAERRIRKDRSDAFAFFASGGRSDVPLPRTFKLDAYGQAGVVSGTSGGAFLDGMLQARRPAGKVGPAALLVGAGVWVGGQEDVLRVDIGPSLAARLPVAGAMFRVEASWRLRVAGNADPANGPAVSLSTSF